MSIIEDNIPMKVLLILHLFLEIKWHKKTTIFAIRVVLVLCAFNVGKEHTFISFRKDNYGVRFSKFWLNRDPTFWRTLSTLYLTKLSWSRCATLSFDSSQRLASTTQSSGTDTSVKVITSFEINIAMYEFKLL